MAKPVEQKPNLVTAIAVDTAKKRAITEIEQRTKERKAQNHTLNPYRYGY